MIKNNEKILSDSENIITFAEEIFSKFLLYITKTRQI